MYSDRFFWVRCIVRRVVEARKSGPTKSKETRSTEDPDTEIIDKSLILTFGSHFQ